MFLQTRIIVCYMTGQKLSDPSNKLVYYGGFADIVSARRRERQIKGWRREKKIRLIESMNPKWMDLYNGLIRRSLPFTLFRVGMRGRR